MYQVELSKKARRAIINLAEKDKEKILIKLLILQKDPFCGKKLVGKLKGSYSLRVWPFRVIYTVYKKKLVVLIVNIGHRKSVYKNK